jgi:VanZ family protein
VAFLYWIPALVYMAGIYFVSSIPDVGPLPGDVSDKSAHTLAYAGLAVVVLYALARGQAAAATIGRAALAFVIASAYGMTDEWHQSFVPGRTADWADVRADAVGAALGALLAWAAAAVRERRERRTV